MNYLLIAKDMEQIQHKLLFLVLAIQIVDMLQVKGGSRNSERYKLREKGAAFRLFRKN